MVVVVSGFGDVVLQSSLAHTSDIGSKTKLLGHFICIGTESWHLQYPWQSLSIGNAPLGLGQEKPSVVGMISDKA